MPNTVTDAHKLVQAVTIPNGNWLFAQRINYNDGFERILFRNGAFLGEIKNAMQSARAQKGDMLYTVNAGPQRLHLAGTAQTRDARGYMLQFRGAASVQLLQAQHLALAYIQALDPLGSLQQAILDALQTMIRQYSYADITEALLKQQILGTQVTYLNPPRMDPIMNYGLRIIAVPDLVVIADERFQKDRASEIIREDIIRGGVDERVKLDEQARIDAVAAHHKHDMDMIVAQYDHQHAQAKLHYGGDLQLDMAIQTLYIDNRVALFKRLIEHYTVYEIVQEHPELQSFAARLPGVSNAPQLTGPAASPQIGNAQPTSPPSAARQASPAQPTPVPHVAQSPAQGPVASPSSSSGQQGKKPFRPEVTETPEWTRVEPAAGVDYDAGTEILLVPLLKLRLKRGTLTEKQKNKCRSYPAHDRCYTILAHPTLPHEASIYLLGDAHVKEPEYLIDEFSRAIQTRGTITIEYVDDSGYKQEVIDTTLTYAE